MLCRYVSAKWFSTYNVDLPLYAYLICYHVKALTSPQIHIPLPYKRAWATPLYIYRNTSTLERYAWGWLILLMLLSKEMRCWFSSHISKKYYGILSGYMKFSPYTLGWHAWVNCHTWQTMPAAKSCRWYRQQHHPNFTHSLNTTCFSKHAFQKDDDELTMRLQSATRLKFRWVMLYAFT